MREIQSLPSESSSVDVQILDDIYYFDRFDVFDGYPSAVSQLPRR